MATRTPWQSLLKIQFYRIRYIRSYGITSRGTTWWTSRETDIDRTYGIFYQALQGDTFVSNPFMGGVELPNERGEFHANKPTQFVPTALKDQDDNVFGVLAFRMRLHKEFNKVLNY